MGSNQSARKETPVVPKNEIQGRIQNDFKNLLNSQKKIFYNREVPKI